MPGTIGAQAVVIGAGMGGLAAAKAVAPHFEQVVVLDRDALPDRLEPRLGTPQASHTHALLASGERALGELFPGVAADFVRAGAITMRMTGDVRVERPGFDPFPSRDLGFHVLSLSRPAIERVCRRRLEADARVDIRRQARVTGILSSPDGRAVAGARYEDIGGRAHELAAELVVDASGRALPTLDFLARNGGRAPQETRIGVDVAYASAIFEPPEGERDWLGLMHIGGPPADGRGGFVFPIENGRWIVSLGQCPSGDMPTDHGGLLAFASTLRTPSVHEALKRARPVTDVARYGVRASVRRHFDRLGDWPRGLVPIGDSVCRFNPLFGQGMSVAAMQATALARLLDERGAAPDALADAGNAFLSEIQPLIDAPWSVAISDFAYAHTTGERPPNLAQRLNYLQAIVRLAAEDAETHRILVEVQHLIAPPAALTAPPIRARAMALMRAAA